MRYTKLFLILGILALSSSISAQNIKRHYITEISTFNIGGRVVYASAVYKHKSVFDANTSVICVMPNPHKKWCLASVSADASVIDKISTGKDISLLPFYDNTGKYLEDGTMKSVNTSSKTVLYNMLSSSGVPVSVFVDTHTVNYVLSRISKVLSVIQIIKSDVDISKSVLTANADTLSKLYAFMDDNGISKSGITGSTNIGKVLDMAVDGYKK